MGVDAMPESPGSLHSRLQARTCTGIFSKTLDSAFVEAAGHAQLDFIILDTEHGPAGWETIQNHIRARTVNEHGAVVSARARAR